MTDALPSLPRLKIRVSIGVELSRDQKILGWLNILYRALSPSTGTRSTSQAVPASPDTTAKSTRHRRGCIKKYYRAENSYVPDRHRSVIPREEDFATKDDRVFPS